MTPPLSSPSAIERVGCCHGCGAKVDQPKLPQGGGRTRKWCSDRCRKAQYGGICQNCGAVTDGSNGRGKAPKMCSACAIESQTKWSRELIVERIQEWARLYGQQPGQVDWNTSHAKRIGHPERAARYLAGDWPSQDTVHNWFGSWNAAIKAAGFVPRAPSWNEDTHRARRRPQHAEAGSL